MSYLRDIMQRLNARTPSRAPDDHLLGVHVDAYAEKLSICTPAMLQYEWAWLEQHGEHLELCRATPEMLAAAGGASRIDRLMEEGRRFRALLAERFECLDLSPALHRATVVPTEHAWDITNEQVRSQWGISDAEGPHPG